MAKFDFGEHQLGSEPVRFPFDSRLNEWLLRMTQQKMRQFMAKSEVAARRIEIPVKNDEIFHRIGLSSVGDLFEDDPHSVLRGESFYEVDCSLRRSARSASRKNRLSGRI